MLEIADIEGCVRSYSSSEFHPAAWTVSFAVLVSPADKFEMASELSVDERIALIKSQLQETLKLDILEDVIRKGERAPVIYWGN